MNKRNLIFAACIAACLAFSGCAEMASVSAAATAQGATNEKAAAKTITAADTLKAQTAADTFCSMNVSTLFQNPQWVAPVKSLCWSGSAQTAADAAALIPGAGTISITPTTAAPAVSPAATTAK